MLYTHAGPEIGVASTKAFTTQLVALYLLALYLRQQLGRRDRAASSSRRSRTCRRRSTQALGARARRSTSWRAASTTRPTSSTSARGINYPIALEGALKLKEISYIHAEGYPAGEMKHGPIALIDETPAGGRDRHRHGASSRR